MMKVQEPPKRATESAMRSPNVDSSSITSFGLRLARTPHQLLRSVKLSAEHGQQIHSGERLALQQDDMSCDQLLRTRFLPGRSRWSDAASDRSWRRTRRTRRCAGSSTTTSC